MKKLFPLLVIVFIVLSAIGAGYVYHWNKVGMYQQAQVLSEVNTPEPVDWDKAEWRTVTQSPQQIDQPQVNYVTATPQPQQQQQQQVQQKSFTYKEAKIDCSYNDGKYSYNFGQLTYSECQMKTNTYWAQEKAKTSTTTFGSYQSRPVNVQFNDPPAAPTVPVGYGYSN